METAIYVIMSLVCFSFLLKQTFQRPLWMVVIAAACGVFVGLAWPYAIEQSRTQIQSWLQNPQLMRDTSVILCIDVALYMWYCILSVNVATEGKLPKRTIWTYRFLRFYPGITMLMVLFSALVALIFAMPGTSFVTIAWGFGASIFVAVPLGSWFVKWLLPEKEIRLEILFLIEAVILMIGIVVTVNGTTAVNGIDEVEWLPTLAIILLTLVGAAVGYGVYRHRLSKAISKH